MKKPVAIRRHAILKRPYRRAQQSTPEFRTLTPAAQWAVLRTVMQADTTAAGAALLDVFDSRAARRDEVLAALEAAHDADVRAGSVTRGEQH
jgi:hypothetical protein